MRFVLSFLFSVVVASCAPEQNIESEMKVEFEFDNELGVDRQTYEPVWVWDRTKEFGDYSVQIPVGEHPIIEASSAHLMELGLQGGGYTWEAMVRASIENTGQDPDRQIEWDSESATMVTYMEQQELAVLVAAHAQKILTDQKHRDAMIVAAKDMD